MHIGGIHVHKYINTYVCTYIGGGGCGKQCRRRRRAVRDWGAPLMESQPVPAAL